MNKYNSISYIIGNPYGLGKNYAIKGNINFFPYSYLLNSKASLDFGTFYKSLFFIVD